jgi:hypothetical protein
LSQDRNWVPAGIRVGGWLTGRDLPRFARDEIGLGAVAGREEGAMVAVRGRIEVAAPLRGLLVDVDGVYRRMIFKLDVMMWVHEAATDFALVDDRGGRVLVHAGDARWLVADRETFEYPATRIDRDGAPPEVRAHVRGRATVEAFEQVLEPGTLVQVVGYKTTSADPTGEAHGYRLPPQRATLRSGPKRPLVITRVADLA